jgi:hypothetical protein
MATYSMLGVGAYNTWLGSIVLEVSDGGLAEVEYIIGGASVVAIVESGDQVSLDESIVGEELQGVIVNVILGEVTVNGVIVPEGESLTISAPVINSLTADPDQLWPPNNKAVDVTIAVDATDPDGPEIDSITYAVADEYGVYDVAETPLPDDGIISLIAERDGKDKDGRVYTITVTVYDAGGLSDSASVDVVVPHDQGKKGK